MTRAVFRALLGAFFIVAGINHFRDPSPYMGMMPPYLPRPELLIMISGVAEVLGGFGVLAPRFRRSAGWGLILLLLAVFPANVQVALHGWPGVDLPRWVLWARLPFQIAFIAWVYWTCLSFESRRENSPGKFLD